MRNGALSWSTDFDPTTILVLIVFVADTVRAELEHTTQVAMCSAFAAVGLTQHRSTYSYSTHVTYLPCLCTDSRKRGLYSRPSQRRTAASVYRGTYGYIRTEYRSQVDLGGGGGEIVGSSQRMSDIGRILCF